MKYILCTILTICSVLSFSQEIGTLDKLHEYLSSKVRLPFHVRHPGFVIAKFGIIGGQISDKQILFSDTKSLSDEVLRLLSLPLKLSSWPDSTVVVVPFSFSYSVDNDTKYTGEPLPVKVQTEIFDKPVHGIILPVVQCITWISWCPIPDPPRTRKAPYVGM